MTTTSTFKPASLYQIDLIDPQTGLTPASIVAPGYLTPPQIANAYGIPASTGAGIKVGIISPGGGGFLQSDLNKSFVDLKAAGLISPSISTPIINQYLFDGQTGSFIGGGAASFENTLDIYCVATMVPEATINMYIGSDYTNPVTQAIADGCDIITISWAGSEYAYNWYETLWTQCAAAGITVVAASGDWGSTIGGQPSLSVCYPAASPQVIAIGGTKLTLTGSNTRLTETDDNRDPAFGPTWGGGGGISDLFSLPTWQQNLHYTPIIGGVIGSPTPLPRRGIPDVAAPMNVYGMYYGGGGVGVGGTSAAAPVWAGILARMQKLTGVKRNSQQYNTIFYANTSSFYDITVGTNNTEIADGYAGTVEWDPVTGLGPPIGASLLSILQPSFTMIVNTSTVILRQFELVTGTLIPVTNPLAASFSISPTLPSGLAFDDYTGEITGSPQSYLHATNFNVTAYDLSGHVATASFSLTVLPTVLVTTATTASVTLTKGIVIDTFAPVTASGGDGNYLYSVTPSMPSGIYYDDYTGEISGIPQSVSSTGTYTVSVTDGFSQHSTSTFKLNVKRAPLSLTVEYPTITVFPFVAIDPIIPVVAHGGFESYLYDIIPALPSGLVFDTYNGEISGIPQVALTATTFTVTVTDIGGGTTSSNFVLSSISSTLAAVPIELSKTLYQDLEIVPFTPISSIGGDGIITFAVVPALPSGLVYNTTSGEITGTPTVTLSTSSFEVIIHDQGTQVVHSYFSLYIDYVRPELTTNFSRVTYTAGRSITPFNPFTASGGTGALTYSISPPLPSGLSLNTSTGQISGTTQLTDHGNTYTITVTDSIGHSSNGEFVIKIVSPLNVINSDDHNRVYDTLFDLMGTTSTGYGATLLGDPVNPGDKVSVDSWNRFLEDIERCLIHQTGTSTNTLSISNTGSIVTFANPARMYTELQFLQANVGQVHPSQIEEFTYNTTSTSPTLWTCTNYSSTASMLAGQGYVTTVNWTWFYENQIRYFFNLGGKLQPEISIAYARLQERASWQALVTAANAGALLGREQFLAALENPSKTYTYIVTGEGTTLGSRRRRGLAGIPDTKYLKHINFLLPSGSSYGVTGLIVTYHVTSNGITGTLNFVAGLGSNKKKKKKVKLNVSNINGRSSRRYHDIFTGALLADYINIQVQFVADFKTTYPTGANGGIAAQKPQTQIVANKVSATPFPETTLKSIPEFVISVGETSSKVITLRNNSTFTCTVSNIALRGYNTGTVTPTALSIPAGGSNTFTVSYTGSYPGHHAGYIDVYCNVNPLTLFTEINVGSTDPLSLNITTSTYDLISQDFVVDHAGGWFKDFNVNFTASPGYSFTELVAGTRDTFNVTFDPMGKSNGTYTSIASVTVNPLDSSQEPSVWNVPLTVHLNVENRHIADWKSCNLGNNTTLGISYDVIGGRTYLTVGIGTGTPSMVQLRSYQLDFASWSEVYRIPLESNTRKVYSRDYCVKFDENFKYGNYFGVGTANGSIITAVYDGLGNLEILMNTVNSTPATNATEVLDMSTAFRYYDSRRAYQLQTVPNLVQGGQTYCFTGFDKHGQTLLSLLSPN